MNITEQQKIDFAKRTKYLYYIKTINDLVDIYRTLKISEEYIESEALELWQLYSKCIDLDEPYHTKKELGQFNKTLILRDDGHFYIYDIYDYNGKIYKYNGASISELKAENQLSYLKELVA